MNAGIVLRPIPLGFPEKQVQILKSLALLRQGDEKVVSPRVCLGQGVQGRVVRSSKSSFFTSVNRSMFSDPRLGLSIREGYHIGYNCANIRYFRRMQILITDRPK